MKHMLQAVLASEGLDMNDEPVWAKLLWGYVTLIFCGVFGLHRFLLGRPVSGLLYLLTGGLMGVGLVFDFFIGVPWMSFNDGDY